MLGLPPPVPDVGDGRFELHERIGFGTGGFVHRARDRERGDVCAVKMLISHDEDPRRGRFLREAQALQSVTHPRVVPIRASGIDDQLLWFAMDLMPGGDLFRYVRRRGVVEPEQALVWLIQVLEALDAMHRRGLIHRDVKPHNVFLDAAGDALLGDLGIVRVVLDEEQMTLSGIPLGTEGYRAPEQDLEPGSASVTADLYGAGNTLRYLLTGLRPGRSALELDTLVPPDIRPLLVGVRSDDPAARMPAAQVMAVAAAAVLDRRLADAGLPLRGDTLLRHFDWAGAPDEDAP